MMGKEWSDEEVELLKEIYPHYTNKELANVFGRTYRSVISKAQQFDLKKTKKHKDEIYSKSNSGANSGNFKNYRIVNSEGYVLVKKPDYPNTQKSGYIPEHKYKMEKKIGRPLKENEVVHHKNGDKTDNKLENLELMTRKQHVKHHHIGAKRSKSAIKNMEAAQKEKYSKMKKSDHPYFKKVNMEEALKLKGKGLTVKEICKSFSISKKTYYNKLHEYERGLKNAQ